jgi:hypothetical protein
MDKPRKPYGEMSLLVFQNRFPTEEACWDHLARLRWPKAVECPGCGGKKVGFIKTRRLMECRGCGRQKSATAGTIFHKSHLPLRQWFWAIYLMGTTPKGVSMRYLQKHLGIKNYRTAWLMGHKIRHAMVQREGLYRLKGTVQVDEIKLGRQNHAARRKRREDRHTKFLMGVQEGDTKNYPRFVSFEQLETAFKDEVLPALEKRVAKGSRLKSDGAGAFRQAEKRGYAVAQVPMTKEPDKAKEHLKWIHWLSSNLKLGLASTYHGCSPKYRKAYLAEFAYRFNRRYWPHQAFDRLLFACIQGKQITLSALTT